MEIISISWKTETVSILLEAFDVRILMFGRGVIASIYGQALQAAGHDIEFYVRPGRAADYGSELQTDIIDARRALRDQRHHASFTTRLRESLELENHFDLVILSVGHHHLAEAVAFLAPRVGQATVLILGNIWQEPLAAVAPLPADRVVFGFPQAGGGFGDNGVLKGALLRSVIIGRAASVPNARELAVHDLFRHAGFAVREEPDLRGWLLIHFISDAGMFAQGSHSGGLAGLIGNRRELRQALLTARQLLPVLWARGVDPRRHRRALLPLRLPTMTAAAMAVASARVPIAQVSLAAHTDPHAVEPMAILRDAQLEAQRLGVPVPRLEEALRLLAAGH